MYNTGLYTKHTLEWPEMVYRGIYYHELLILYMTYRPQAIMAIYITNKHIFGMKCDVGMMIDCDVAEKRYESKVGMSSY